MGPCTPWVTLADAQAVPGCADIDEDVLADMIDVASELLYALSGRQYAGVCADVVRPCARRHACHHFVYPNWWVGDDSWGICSCSGVCGCGALSRVSLGAYPIRAVTQVRIDGTIVASSAYRVDDRRWLVRLDGAGWPASQDLTGDPLTDPDTFEVSFTWGQAPPRSGAVAARHLACELAKLETGRDHRLPPRVQTLSRQGLSMVLVDPQLFLDRGRTGIFLVDLFLGAVNPHRLARRAQVISPDVCKPVTRVGTVPGS